MGRKFLTWSSCKAFDRFPSRVLGPSAHRHPADVPGGSRLPRLHHGPHRLNWLPGFGRVARRADLHHVDRGLGRLARIGRLRREDDGDVDLLDSGSGFSRIWERSDRLVRSQVRSCGRTNKQTNLKELKSPAHKHSCEPQTNIFALPISYEPLFKHQQSNDGPNLC